MIEECGAEEMARLVVFKNVKKVAEQGGSYLVSEAAPDDNFQR